MHGMLIMRGTARLSDPMAKIRMCQTGEVILMAPRNNIAMTGQARIFHHIICAS